MTSGNDHDARRSLTGKRWHWPTHTLTANTNRDEATGLPAWQAIMLAGRGIVGADAIRQYLAPTLTALLDPAEMADMPKALDLLQTAITERWPIVIYGDYDVDGVCSTALLTEFLQALGGVVDFYIPERRSEGYGLNEAAVRDICGRAKLLITTDCGVTAVDEIRLARSLGCEVVVVDHHRAGPTMPPAGACLDPQRSDCGFASGVLCATGVAFMLAVALRRALRDCGAFNDRPEPDIRSQLDLVALATVADMVPLVGINRILVATGLKRLASTARPGLRALIDVAGIRETELTSSDIAFRLAPRINARGRVSHAREAVQLMLTNDIDEAKNLAAALDVANHHRRELENETVAKAMSLAVQHNLAEDAAVVLHDPTWHPGVLGLVALRVTTAYSRPAVVIGENGKGSGRSIPGLDLHAAIGDAAAHLVRFGGHAAAAGVTIEAARVDDFRRALALAVRTRLGPPPYVPTLAPEMEIDEEALFSTLLPAIAHLAPFGKDNPEPLWVTPNLAVRSVRIVGDNHLKLTLGSQNVEAIGFRLAHLAQQLPACIDLVHHMTRDTYGGRDKLMLRIEDLRAATPDAP